MITIAIQRIRICLPCSSSSSSKAISKASSPLNFDFRSLMNPLRFAKVFASCACSLTAANGEAIVGLNTETNIMATEVKTNLENILDKNLTIFQFQSLGLKTTQ